MQSFDELKDLVNKTQFEQFQIVVRAKIDDFNSSSSDETRFRYQAVRVNPINYKEENEMLLRRLDMYSQKYQ